MGKAEGQGPPKGYACLQEIHRSEADECGHAEETVGHDEDKMGGGEESGLMPCAPVLEGAWADFGESRFVCKSNQRN